jgi:sRNA-binding carbon storage regulator CsrA
VKARDIDAPPGGLRLTLKLGESLTINDELHVTVMAVAGKTVRLRFVGPHTFKMELESRRAARIMREKAVEVTQ